MRPYIYSMLLLLFSCLAVTTMAKEQRANEQQRVFGWVEKAIVMPVGALVKVKLDTGALTSSIHAKNIETYDIEDDGHGVRFELELEDKESGAVIKRQMDLPIERYLILRGAGGEDRRPVVKLSLCIGDRVYREEFSLRDRGNMIYPVLIGRRTIRDLGLVDTGATFVSEPECAVEEAVKERTAPGM